MFPVAAPACGSVAQAFASMMLEADKDRLESFLESQACHDNLKFSPHRADRHVAIVLMNSAHAGVSKNLFGDVLARFNCVARLRSRSGYQVLVNYLGAERFAEVCDADKLDRVYVVTASGGANLRASPSMVGEKLAAVADGVVANDGKQHGEWLEVTTYLGRGFLHESTLTKYLQD